MGPIDYYYTMRLRWCLSLLDREEGKRLGRTHAIGPNQIGMRSISHIWASRKNYSLVVEV